MERYGRLFEKAGGVWRQNLVIVFGLLCLGGSTVVHGSVVTEPLSWQVRDLQTGLDRLKEQFLDVSIMRDTEFVGAVLQTGAGLYEFTHGRGKPGQDQVSFRIFRPEDARLVGLCHTHGERISGRPPAGHTGVMEV